MNSAYEVVGAITLAAVGLIGNAAVAWWRIGDHGSRLNDLDAWRNEVERWRGKVDAHLEGKD